MQESAPRKSTHGEKFVYALFPGYGVVRRNRAIDIPAIFFHYYFCMDFPGLTSAYLESLSTGELIKLAEKYCADIPADPKRNLIVKELLEYNEKSANNLSENEENDGSGKSAALPKQYNISFVEVNVRDPLWAFVFWEIKNQDREQYENASGFQGYCLHVIPLADNGEPSGEAPFTVTVNGGDVSRYLGFPPGGGRRFQIELRVRQKNGVTVLAASKPFLLPVLINRETNRLDAPPSGEAVGVSRREREIQAAYQNPLALLSGAGAYSLTSSVDRCARQRDS